MANVPVVTDTTAYTSPRPRRPSASSGACRDEVFHCEPLFVSELGPVLSAHAGPGLLGMGSIPTRLLA